MGDAISRLLDELKQHLVTLYGPRLSRVLLYGSQARGTAARKSDVDILVVLHGEVEPAGEIGRTGEIVTDLCLEYDELLSLVFMSEDEFRRGAGPFLRNVYREAVPV